MKRKILGGLLALVMAGSAAATPPLPMPPIPRDASWILSQPVPPLKSTGDPKVDAFRRTLIELSNRIGLFLLVLDRDGRK